MAAFNHRAAVLESVQRILGSLSEQRFYGSVDLRFEAGRCCCARLKLSRQTTVGTPEVIMTENRVNPPSPGVTPSSQPDTDAAPGLSSGIQESTDEQLESASAEAEKVEGKEQVEPEAPLRVPSLVHRNGYLIETVYKPEAHGFLS